MNNIAGNNDINKLRTTFSFWYSGDDNRKNMTKEDFMNNLKCIYSFDTLEDYWLVFLRLKLPSELPLYNKLYLFYFDIPPIWENPKNKFGGRIFIKVLKCVGDIVWQNLCLTFLKGYNKYNKYINGIQLVKKNEDVVLFTIWINNNEVSVIEGVFDWLKNEIEIPSDYDIEYQNHPRHKNSTDKYNYNKN